MQKNPKYEDVLLDIYDFFEEKINFCINKNFKKQFIVIDPGIGFGKNLNQNLSILKNINKFKIGNHGLMLGSSRKSWISKIDNSLINQRLGGSVSSVIYCLDKGVDIFRVHDVQETKQAIDIYNKIKCSQ